MLPKSVTKTFSLESTATPVKKPIGYVLLPPPDPLPLPDPPEKLPTV